jgi:MoaA/NifB/PqqE/SkfB family radical SAM enzyme
VVSKGRNFKLSSFIAATGVLNQLVKYKITGKKIPLVLNLLVTNKCNLDCAYCYVDHQTRKMPDLSFDQLRGVIDDFYQLGTRSVWIQGGEPLLRSDVGEIINYVKSKRIFCEIVTNGWFAEEKMDILSKADKISFSIDGDEETHDRVRKKGSHQRIIRSLRKAKRMGLNYRLHAVLNVHNMNQNNVDYLCRLAKKMRTSVSFTYAIIPVEKQKSRKDKKDLYFERKDFQEIIRYILKRKQEGEPIHHTAKLLTRVLNWSLPYHEIGFKDNVPAGSPQCLYGRLVCFLDADGMLYPCSKYFEAEGKGMSVIDHGAKKAWNHVSKLNCVACGKLSEMNAILSVNPVNLVRVARDYLLNLND